MKNNTNINLLVSHLLILAKMGRGMQLSHTQLRQVAMYDKNANNILMCSG